MPFFSKRVVFEAVLDQPRHRPGIATLALLARHPQNKLPDALLSCAREDGLLVLNYSYRFNTPLSVDDAGVSAVLSRAGSNYETYVAWDAVLSVVDDETKAMAAWPISADAVGAMRASDDVPDAPEKARSLRVVR